MGWLALLVVLVGCADPSGPPSGPPVAIIPVDTDPLPEYIAGPRAWEEIGFVVGGPTDLSECPRRWYETGETDCQISITVVRGYTRERYGSDAVSDIQTRGIFVDFRYTDPNLLLVAMAHEAGHILLDTREHTLGGIMGGATATVTPQDRELACSTIGRGC